MTQTLTIDGRKFRTDGQTSPISGRLTTVEYQRDCGAWKPVRNVSRRYEVQNLLEAGAAS